MWLVDVEERKNNIIVQRENITKEERIWVRCYDLGYYQFNFGAIFDCLFGREVIATMV